MLSSRGSWERCKKGTLVGGEGGGFGLSGDLTERLVCLAGCAVLYPPKSSDLTEELS